MNLTYDVGGSLDETDWLSVYITNMEVMATGILVLKCSSLKYTVIYQTKNEWEIRFDWKYLGYDKNTKGGEVGGK